ncbi:hypothetical protein IWQ61_010129 [Dispira simplex]|nr:hypothetical protein IWQ61_010129 [Dispira simplex]
MKLLATLCFFGVMLTPGYAREDELVNTQLLVKNKVNTSPAVDKLKRDADKYTSGKTKFSIAVSECEWTRKDGSQPKEITRADGIHYSLMDLSLLMALGYLGDLVGVDVWNQKSSVETTIEDAVKFLSYISGSESWPKSADQPKDFTHTLQNRRGKVR